MHWVSRDFGWVANQDYTRQKDIVVSFPDKVDDGVVLGLGLVTLGSLILNYKSIPKYIVGTTIIFAGVAIALHEQFYRGANEFWRAESEALIDVHCLQGPIDDYIFG